MTQTRKRESAPRVRCCGAEAALRIPQRLFRALCDPTRVALLGRLLAAREPLAVSAVAAGFPLNVSVVSRHLAQLREAGVVEAERRGKEVRYAVCTPFLVGTLHALAEAFEGCSRGTRAATGAGRRRRKEEAR